MPSDQVKRRLAAILAADVVGYSRLMGEDETGTLAVLRARRKDVLEPLVARHRGRIFKVMGDGAFVEFRSAVDAVQCAIELQDAMAKANAGLPEGRRIVLRMGINLGDVIVEGGDLYGDGINVAPDWNNSQNQVASWFPVPSSSRSGTRLIRPSPISARRPSRTLWSRCVFTASPGPCG
jgi:hypothetical protein